MKKKLSRGSGSDTDIVLVGWLRRDEVLEEVEKEGEKDGEKDGEKEGK